MFCLLRLWYAAVAICAHLLLPVSHFGQLTSAVMVYPPPDLSPPKPRPTLLIVLEAGTLRTDEGQQRTLEQLQSLVNATVAGHTPQELPTKVLLLTAINQAQIHNIPWTAMAELEARLKSLDFVSSVEEDRVVAHIM